MWQIKKIVCVAIVMALLATSTAQGQWCAFKQYTGYQAPLVAPMWYYYGINPYTLSVQTRIQTSYNQSYALPIAQSNESVGIVVDQPPVPVPGELIDSDEEMPAIGDQNQNSLNDRAVVEPPQPDTTDSEADAEVESLKQLQAAETKMQQELAELRAQARASEERARAAERRAQQLQKNLNELNKTSPKEGSPDDDKRPQQ